MRFDDLASALSEIRGTRQVPLVSIDGPGSAGKSTFAGRLAAAIGDAQVVRMDDLQGGNQDCGPSGWGWGRLRDEVLRPIFAGERARYRIYDWGTRAIGSKERVVDPSGIVIVEGLYSARRELRTFYDFTVWMQCPVEVKRARARARHVNRAIEEIEAWIEEEAAYNRDHDTVAYADIIASGAGLDSHEEFDRAELHRID